jgi:hypothetical protein
LEVIPTRKLLHELPANTEQHAVSNFLLAIPEECCPRTARRSFPLLVDCVLDLCDFPTQVGLLHIQLTGVGMEASEDYKSLISAVVRD